MAKNKLGNLKASMSGRQKPTDKEIEEVASEVHNPSKPEKSKKLKGLHVLLPQADFDKLTHVSKEMSFPKKIILLQALRDYFEKHGF